MRRCLALVFLLAACGGPSFESADPNGWQACAILVEIYQSSDGNVRAGGILRAGTLAAKAESADIRASAEELAPAIATADVHKLEAACEAHGVVVPERLAVVHDDGSVTP